MERSKVSKARRVKERVKARYSRGWRRERKGIRAMVLAEGVAHTVCAVRRCYRWRESIMRRRMGAV